MSAVHAINYFDVRKKIIAYIASYENGIFKRIIVAGST